jgi:hypothetical protein
MTTPQALCRLPQLNQHGHPLDALSRTYAAPTSPINIAEALQLSAQPGTFRYQLEKERKMESEGRKEKETDEEERKEEFERAKRALQSAWGNRVRSIHIDESRI